MLHVGHLYAVVYWLGSGYVASRSVVSSLVQTWAMNSPKASAPPLYLCSSGSEASARRQGQVDWHQIPTEEWMKKQKDFRNREAGKNTLIQVVLNILRHVQLVKVWSR